MSPGMGIEILNKEVPQKQTRLISKQVGFIEIIE